MRPGLTTEEHGELGTELRAIRSQLLKLVVNLSRKYALKSKVVALATRAEMAVGDLRCEMDDLFLAENPEGESPYYAEKRS